MKNINKKSILLVIMLVILQSYMVAYAQDEDAGGTFQLDTDNDASSFVSWYDSTTLIEPDNDVLFYTVVEDIDNASDHLTVTIWYSNDSFGLYNESQVMAYASTPSSNNYRFTHLFAGQPVGTYFQYYFSVYDGDNFVYQPAAYEAGILFDIQWDNPPEGPAGGGVTPRDEEAITPEEFRDINIMITLPTLLVGALIIVGVRQYVKHRESHY